MANITDKVTVIGLGPMGQAFTRLFIEKGIHTTVWNRTASRADQLVAAGAILAPTPADAVAASNLIVLSLTDYQAMYDILTPAISVLSGKVIVNLSSDTPESSRKAAEWAASHGAAFISGGVMVPPPMVGNPGAFTFFSGPKDVFDLYQPTLEILGVTDYRGSDPGLAQFYYQALLDIMFTSVAGVLHATAFLRSAGVSGATFEPYMKNFLTFLPEMLTDMMIMDETDSGKYYGELNNMIMMAAGMDHITHASKEAGIDTTLPAAVKAIYDETVARGYGRDGLGSIYEVLKNPSK